LSVKIAGLVLAAALVAGRAAAQAPSSTPGVKPSGLTDSEKLEKSEQHVGQMKGALKQVLGRVEEARNEKDVVKLNCVNEKLTQIKALLKVAEQADVALHEAIANRDPGADTEFSKVGIARTKIDALRSDADQCVGQLAYVVDERTTVEVQQPEGLPDRDVTDRKPIGSGWATTPVVRPPPASRSY
jgi:TolA-binding protein